MAFQTFELNVKIFAPAVGNRGNIILDRSYFGDPAYVDYRRFQFGLNQNVRIVKVSSMCYPLPGNSFTASFSGGELIPLRYQWFLVAFWTDFDGKRIRIPLPVNVDPPVNPNGLFYIDTPRLSVSNDNAVYEHPCIYAGGMQIDTVGVMFSQNFNVVNTYWGRILLQIVVEI